MFPICENEVVDPAFDALNFYLLLFTEITINLVYYEKVL